MEVEHKYDGGTRLLLVEERLLFMLLGGVPVGLGRLRRTMVTTVNMVGRRTH